MRHPISRAHFAGGRWLIREVLSRRLARPPQSIDIGIDSHGRPFLSPASTLSSSSGRLLSNPPANPPSAGNEAIDFSLSHSGAAIVSALAIAAAGGERPAIGIDIERVDSKRNWQAIAERRFSLAERRSLRRYRDDDARRLAFFRTWVRKEAFVKALGTGISTNFSRFDVATGAVPSLNGLRIEGEERDRWTIRDLPIPKAVFDKVLAENIVGAIAWKSPRSMDAPSPGGPFEERPL